MERVPLLGVSRGFFHLLQGLSLPLLPLLFCQTERIKKTIYKFSGGGWVKGQPKPLFATYASALLAGINLQN